MTLARQACVVAALAALAATSISAQQNDQQVPRDRSRPIKVDPSYQRLADETGGTVWVFDREFERTHPGLTGKVMAADYVANRALVTTHGEISGYKSFEASLQGDESKLVVTMTGNNLRSFEVRRPNGIAVADDGVQNIFAKLGNGGVFVIASPEPGVWTAVLDGEGTYSVHMNVAAGSSAHRESPIVTSSTPSTEHPSADIDFDDFQFQQVAGRPGHEGLFKIDGYPVAGKTYPVEARISGDFSTVRFEFRGADGQPLQSLELKRDREQDLRDERTYTGEALIPAVPFRIYATGLDQRGQRYQRSLTHLVRPQSFTVSGPGMTEWQPGESPTVTFGVTNFGEAADFEATIVDTAKFLKSGAKIRFALAAGESRQLDLAFDVPIATSATRDTVVVTVMRANDPNATNHSVVEPSIFKRN
jgi:von Willebrand factor A domain-containing protein 7